MLNVAREKVLLERMIRRSAPLTLEWGGGYSASCCRFTLKADISATLYGIEDRYECSVMLVCPEVPPKSHSAVTLNGCTYVVIGLQPGPGDVSLRLDLREKF